MEQNNSKLKVAESKEIINTSDNVKEDKQKSQNKKPLTPYQKYKNSRNQNGKKYFEFYDDIKVYTHNIWDW